MKDGQHNKARKDIFVCVQKHLPCVGEAEILLLLLRGVEYFWVFFVFFSGGVP